MVTEFVFRADIEIPFAPIPGDINSAKEWDLYWLCRRDMPSPGELQTRCDREWLRVFRERGYRSILFAANGLSQEPQFFAYAGFQTVALELSEVATELARTARWKEQTLLRSFGVSSLEKESFLRDMVCFGGSASYEAGSLFAEDVCEGPFDVIIVRRTLQLFSSARLRLALQALRKRLSDTGTLIVEVAESFDAKARVAQAMLREGFRLRGMASDESWNAELIFTPA
jgi:hypothetical protein